MSDAFFFISRNVGGVWMYSYNSRVRYSECDASGILRMEALVNYFQDGSTFQSEDIGVGVERLKERNRCWVLCSWNIKVNRLPKFGEDIEVLTWPTTMNGIIGDRFFELKTIEGESLAVAKTVWTFFDTVKQKPARIDEEISSRYILGQPYEADWGKRKILLPDEWDTKDVVLVQEYHLDTNNHMNNGKYIEVAMSYLPKDFFVKEMRVEYRRQALLGDCLVPHINRSDACVIVNLANEQGEPYAVIEFKTE